MKLILKYIKKYRLIAAIPPVMIIFGVIADLAQPTLMGRIVDEGIMKNDLPLIFQTGIRMFGFAVLGMVTGLIVSRCAARVSVNAAADLREDLFRKIQSLSYGNLDRLKTGSLITRLTNDVSQIEKVVLLSLRIVIRAPFKIIGSLIMAIIIGRELSWILVLLSVLIVLVISLLVNRAYPFFKVVQERLDRVNTLLQENLGGIRLIKSFLREPYEKEKFRQANDDFIEANIRANRLMALLHPAIHFIMNTGIIAVLWFGGELVGSGDLQIGKVMAFINYLTQMLFMLSIISHVLIMVSRARVSINRIEEVFNEVPEINDTPGATDAGNLKGAVSFENVTFSYKGSDSDPVLNDISFTLEPGETLAIMGATGSGKTTLVNLIPRFYETDSGRITIDGTDIRDINRNSLRKRIAVVPQTSLLFSGSIRRNILFGKGNENHEGADESISRAAAEASVSDFIDSLPEGYETNVNQRGANLSGGQKQRISLARALVCDPDILILDDFTSAVDLKTETSVLNNLARRKSEITCIIIAQRISSVRGADRILVLDRGRIAALGTHEELWAGSDLYRDICLSQMDEEEVTA